MNSLKRKQEINNAASESLEEALALENEEFFEWCMPNNEAYRCQMWKNAIVLYHWVKKVEWK